jgi:hypothetical protein
MEQSLTLHGTWTWSKQMDSGGFQDTTFRIKFRHIDSNDRTHRVTLSGVYLLPVGRARSFLGNPNRIVDGAIGGWELGSLFIYQTGTPYSVPGQDNQIASPYTHPYINPSNGYTRLVAPCVEQWKEDAKGNYSLQQLTQTTLTYTALSRTYTGCPTPTSGQIRIRFTPAFIFRVSTSSTPTFQRTSHSSRDLHCRFALKPSTYLIIRCGRKTLIPTSTIKRLARLQGARRSKAICLVNSRSQRR